MLTQLVTFRTNLGDRDSGTVYLRDSAGVSPVDEDETHVFAYTELVIHSPVY